MGGDFLCPLLGSYSFSLMFVADPFWSQDSGPSVLFSNSWTISLTWDNYVHVLTPQDL